MESVEKISKRIAAAVARSLEKGLKLEKDILFFLESTYGIDTQTFPSLLKHGDFEDIDTVFNLVFPPSHGTRMAVELELVEAESAQVDRELVLEYLFRMLPSVKIVLPDCSGFSCKFSFGAAEILVRKLYLEREHDPETVEILQEFLKEKDAVETLVYIRRKGLKLTTDMKRFLRLFMQGTARRDHIPAGMICRFLKILSGTPECVSAEQHFFRQKRQLGKKLSEIWEFQRKMNQYGMEYLLMQRYQVPHESEETVVEQMAWIDFMLERVMGLRDPEEVYIGRRDLGSFNSGDDIEKLFRTLE